MPPEPGATLTEDERQVVDRVRDYARFLLPSNAQAARDILEVVRIAEEQAGPRAPGGRTDDDDRPRA
jgi:hypothetical protein